MSMAPISETGGNFINRTNSEPFGKSNTFNHNMNKNYNRANSGNYNKNNKNNLRSFYGQSMLPNGPGPNPNSIPQMG